MNLLQKPNESLSSDSSTVYGSLDKLAILNWSEESTKPFLSIKPYRRVDNANHVQNMSDIIETYIEIVKTYALRSETFSSLRMIIKRIDVGQETPSRTVIDMALLFQDNMLEEDARALSERAMREPANPEGHYAELNNSIEQYFDMALDKQLYMMQLASLLTVDLMISMVSKRYKILNHNTRRLAMDRIRRGYSEFSRLGQWFKANFPTVLIRNTDIRRNVLAAASHMWSEVLPLDIESLITKQVGCVSFCPSDIHISQSMIESAVSTTAGSVLSMKCGDIGYFEPSSVTRIWRGSSSYEDITESYERYAHCEVLDKKHFTDTDWDEELEGIYQLDAKWAALAEARIDNVNGLLIAGFFGGNIKHARLVVYFEGYRSGMLFWRRASLTVNGKEENHEYNPVARLTQELLLRGPATKHLAFQQYIEDGYMKEGQAEWREGTDDIKYPYPLNYNRLFTLQHEIVYTFPEHHSYEWMTLQLLFNFVDGDKVRKIVELQDLIINRRLVQEKFWKLSNTLPYREVGYDRTLRWSNSDGYELWPTTDATSESTALLREVIKQRLEVRGWMRRMAIGLKMSGKAAVQNVSEHAFDGSTVEEVALQGGLQGFNKWLSEQSLEDRYITYTDIRHLLNTEKKRLISALMLPDDFILKTLRRDNLCFTGQEYQQAGLKFGHTFTVKDLKLVGTLIHETSRGDYQALTLIPSKALKQIMRGQVVQGNIHLSISKDDYDHKGRQVPETMTVGYYE
jgi:hypothetical protein